MGRQWNRDRDDERTRGRSSKEGSRGRESRQDNEFSFKIVKCLGVIEEYQSGWSKEANIVEWNGNKAKVDIRDWDPEHQHMGRGITLHRGEAVALMKILQEHFGTGKNASSKSEEKAASNEAESDECSCCGHAPCGEDAQIAS